jgi:hypothetical protein
MPLYLRTSHSARSLKANELPMEGGQTNNTLVSPSFWWHHRGLLVILLLKAIRLFGLGDLDSFFPCSHCSWTALHNAQNIAARLTMWNCFQMGEISFNPYPIVFKIAGFACFSKDQRHQAPHIFGHGAFKEQGSMNEMICKIRKCIQKDYCLGPRIN